MVTQAYRLNAIREIHLLNFKTVEMRNEDDDNLVTVLCIFAEVNHDELPIVVDDRI